MREDAATGWCEPSLVETFIDLQQSNSLRAVDVRVRSWAEPRPCVV
jgi:hypothetical protein